MEWVVAIAPAAVVIPGSVDHVNISVKPTQKETFMQTLPMPDNTQTEYQV